MNRAERPSKTVVLIHGAWLTPACWDLFRGRYEAQGYTCVAPPWPYCERPVLELRRAPHPGLGKLTVTQIVDHYDALIRALPEPPILIGHSFGGLFVQLLLQRGLGCAGVAIDPAPPKGILPGPLAVWGALPVFFTWRAWSRPVTMTARQFAWDFAHLSPPAEQRAAYDRYVVPTAGRLYFHSVAGIGTAVDFRKPDRAPLLLIAGDEDRTAQPGSVEAAYKKHLQSSATTSFKRFPGRTHWLIAARGWEEIADAALKWATEHEQPTPTTRAVRG